MTYELQPNRMQASFYGKAILTVYNGYRTLRSYDTPVAAINQNGKFIRLWQGYSATTMLHINAFRAQYNLKPIGKAEWERLQIEPSEELWNRLQEFNNQTK